MKKVLMAVAVIGLICSGARASCFLWGAADVEVFDASANGGSGAHVAYSSSTAVGYLFLLGETESVPWYTSLDGFSYEGTADRFAVTVRYSDGSQRIFTYANVVGAVSGVSGGALATGTSEGDADNNIYGVLILDPLGSEEARYAWGTMSYGMFPETMVMEIVPEPGTAGLAALGLAVLTLCRKRLV